MFNPSKAQPGAGQISSMRHWAKAFRTHLRRSGVGRIGRVAWDFAVRSHVVNRASLAFLRHESRSRTYEIALPAGHAAKSVRITLSVPPLPRRDVFAFAEHAVDATGAATNTVLATAMGGFAVSHDLGASWNDIRVPGCERRRIVNAKYLGGSEYLLQTTQRFPDRSDDQSIAVLVVDEHGKVLASNAFKGAAWHSCRAVDLSNGTLMYAEYPFEDPNKRAGQHVPCRVFRSRDRGRSWEIVRTTDRIRHFHFLQARPGVPGEWWLTSGDAAQESRIWVSRDDGDSWTDLTEPFGDSVEIAGIRYPRTLFRLTDMAWDGSDMVWGTDDYLNRTRNGPPGARVFRSPSGPGLQPADIGFCKSQVRSMVDIGDYFIVLTQSGTRVDATPEDRMPAAFLLSKNRGSQTPQMVHLFNVENHSALVTGFTYSRASRAAKDGTFFTFRANTDALYLGHKALRWDVAFD